MTFKSFSTGAVLVYTLLALTGAPVSGGDLNDDNEKPSLSGVWKQTGGNLRIEFADKDTVKIFPHDEEKLLCIVCEYTADKTGLVKVKITKLTGDAKDKAEKIVPVGLEFSFKWTSKDDKGTLEDVKGKEVETLKSHLEGKYDQTK